jgi:uncharacterized membrane protein
MIGLAGLGPTFVAASLAAFAGEHFTLAPSLAQLVPRWLPARLFIAYFVGAAHLAAATSFVTRRYVRWAALGLGVMFALFVLLMDLPGSIAHPASRINWMLAARETTFAIGGFALFATMSRLSWPRVPTTLIGIARLWTAFVLVYYGIDHVLHPRLSPGVPGTELTAAWVPLPRGLAYATGAALIASGIAMVAEKYAASAAALSGCVMLVLTLVLYVPQFFLARTASQYITAYNVVFDTLLFAGTLLVICRAVARDARVPVFEHRVSNADTALRPGRAQATAHHGVR